MLLGVLIPKVSELPFLLISSLQLLLLFFFFLCLFVTQATSTSEESTRISVISYTLSISRQCSRW